MNLKQLQTDGKEIYYQTFPIRKWYRISNTTTPIEIPKGDLPTNLKLFSYFELTFEQLEIIHSIPNPQFLILP